MTVNLKDAAKFLLENDDYYILTHINPDGDTLGAGFALADALRSMGKNANVLCSDELPLRYLFLFDKYQPWDFEDRTIVSVDIADLQLLGDELSIYKDRIDLCIDHHVSNSMYAKRTFLDGAASATCEMMYNVIVEMGVPINKTIAKCLYTGIATDTGCFKYGNTTVAAHVIAGELISHDIDFAIINHLMFDLKTRSRLKAEQILISNMEFHLDGMCALITITKDLIKQTQVDESEFDGLASIPRQVEGVSIGVTIKEKETGVYKISMRSSDNVDVSQICGHFGGGGHTRAAGCQLEGELDEIKARILKKVEESINLLSSGKEV